jgi:hypothetical protein
MEVPGTPSPLRKYQHHTCSLPPGTPNHLREYSRRTGSVPSETPSPLKRLRVGAANTPACERDASRKQLFSGSRSEESSTPKLEQSRPSDVQGRDTESGATRFPEKENKKPPGKPSLVSKFPAIVPVVRDFVHSRGFGAHERRRDIVGSVGVSLKEIKEHVQREIPALAEAGISLNSISRLFPAPNQQRAARSRYKGLIPARVGQKQNDKSKGHVDSHFAAAQVKYALELSSCYGEEIIAISADAKAKVNVGTVAVSRYVKMKTFLLEDDMPHLADHDFPSCSKITPMGYMELVWKSKDHQWQTRQSKSTSPVRCDPRLQCPPRRAKSESPKRCKLLLQLSENDIFSRDSQGRKHYKFARSGPLHMFFRAGKFQKDSALSHHQDLIQILQPLTSTKKAVILVVDNGPDWNKTSCKTFLAMGRLWKQLKLDYFLLISYAPGDSKYNPIEHAWAPITMWWSALVLPVIPDHTEEEVLDSAMTSLEKTLEGKQYDGFPIHTNSITCVTSHQDLKDEDAAIDKMSNASRKALLRDEKLSSLKKEYTFLSQHAVQYTYGLEFVRCQSATCDHCTSFQPKAEKTLSLMHKIGHLFTPHPSQNHPGKYATFIECMSMVGKTLLLPDEGLPSKSVVLRCREHGCNKVFQSKADADRHNKLVHK